MQSNGDPLESRPQFVRFDSGIVNVSSLVKGALVDVPLQEGKTAVGHVKKFDANGKVLVELADGAEVIGHVHFVKDIAPKLKRLGFEDVEVELRQLWQNSPSPTLIIFSLCVLVFMVSEIFPTYKEWTQRNGAMQSSALRSYKAQWWRTITCTFLHVDLYHLALNMLGLVSVGSDLEKQTFYGKLRFIFIYIFCGIVSSLLSSVWNKQATSVGASGAIFGCIAVHQMHRMIASKGPAQWIQFCNLLILAGPDAFLAITGSENIFLRGAVMVLSLMANQSLNNGYGKVHFAITAHNVNAISAFALDRHIDHVGHFGGYLAGVYVGLILLPNHFSGQPESLLVPPHQDRNVESCKGIKKNQRTTDPSKLRAEKYCAAFGVAAIFTFWAYH